MDDDEDDQSSEDHHTLLIKAWEQKVFPTIRRRFRNEAERKDGLEQIRGALLLGESRLPKALNRYKGPCCLVSLDYLRPRTDTMGLAAW